MPEELNNRSTKSYRPPAVGARWPGPQLERFLNQAAMRSSVVRWVLTAAFMPLMWRLAPRINYDEDNFFVEVRPKRINKNVYGTIGGAAVLANLELAGGAYLIMRSAGRHRLVCRALNYRFLLPSTTGLHIKVAPITEHLAALIATNKPFNASVKLTVHARGKAPGTAGRRIGRGEAQFHVWPIPGVAQ